MSPEEHRMLKVGSIYVPVIMVFSMIIGAVYFTYLVSTERAGIYNKISTVENNIQLLTQNLNKFIEATQNQLQDRTRDRYSRTDFLIDCLRIEIANPSWKCPYSGQLRSIQ